MRFVTVRELRSRSAELWRRLAEEGDLVVTSNGRPVALLSAIPPDALEESLAALRRARATAAVEAMQRQSLMLGTDRMPPAEIEAEVAAVRKGRAR
ncbi:MAG: type II toxin-antitoxin system prevent-host-death family antitoxin [Thermoguttaceae bacterium]|jgi:prevent-host-death family protein